MEINFLFHGLFMDRVIRLNTSVQLQDTATFTELLEAIRPQIGFDLLTRLKNGSENPVILLNGENLTLPNGLDQPLRNGDEVSILQAVAGG